MLGVIAAPELDARYARLRVTPRLLSALCGVEALAALAPSAPLIARGAVRYVEHDGPAVDRPLRVAARLAGFLLRAPLPAPELRRVDAPAVDPGRADEVARLAELAAARGSLPLVVSGPDAPELLARALGRGLILVDGPCLDAELAAALEGRAVVYDCAGRSRRAARGRAGARRDRRPRRPRRPAPHRPPAGVRRARRGVARAHRRRRRRRREREVPALDRADRGGGAGRARARPRSRRRRARGVLFAPGHARQAAEADLHVGRPRRPATASSTRCTRSPPTCATATRC